MPFRQLVTSSGSQPQPLLTLLDDEALLELDVSVLVPEELLVDEVWELGMHQQMA